MQNEFFHTFNTLYEAGRQIVLTSDRPPSDMHLLDDRLRTRFEWGLLVDVQPPDFETRLAIVKNKAAQWGTVIDDDIARYIAENVTSNVRQLEGTMNKILAYRDLIGREMDADAAHRAVEDFMKKNANLAPTAAMIITETSRYFGIDEEVIKGPSRSREAVNARQAAMYLVRRMTNLVDARYRPRVRQARPYDRAPLARADRKEDEIRIPSSTRRSRRSLLISTPRDNKVFHIIHRVVQREAVETFFQNFGCGK